MTMLAVIIGILIYSVVRKGRIDYA